MPHPCPTSWVGLGGRFPDPALRLVLDHLAGGQTEALSAHTDETALQVDVRAAESEQLSLPDAAQPDTQDQRPVSPVDSVGQPVQLGYSVPSPDRL